MWMSSPNSDSTTFSRPVLTTRAVSSRPSARRHSVLTFPLADPYDVSSSLVQLEHPLTTTSVPVENCPRIPRGRRCDLEVLPSSGQLWRSVTHTLSIRRYLTEFLKTTSDNPLLFFSQYQDLLAAGNYSSPLVANGLEYQPTANGSDVVETTNPPLSDELG